MTAAWALVRTALAAGVLGLALWAGLTALASMPDAQFVLAIVLAAPAGLLLMWKTAEELRTGVHVTWRATVGRRERPVFYWLSVGFEAAAAVLLLSLAAFSALRLFEWD